MVRISDVFLKETHVILRVKLYIYMLIFLNFFFVFRSLFICRKNSWCCPDSCLKKKKERKERERERECAFHLQNPGDVAGSSTTVRKFNYFLPGGIRQRSAINKHTTELVYTTVTYTEKQRASRSSHHVCTHTHTQYKYAHKGIRSNQTQGGSFKWGGNLIQNRV